MATSIVVEDGTIVSGANSYVSTATAIAYALKRGVTIANVADAADVYLYKAMATLETMMYKGVRTTSVNATSWATVQSTQWPREYVYIEDVYLDNDVIPYQLKDAQCELVMAIYAGYDPLQTITGEDNIIRKKFDVFEKEYAHNAPVVPVIQKVNAMIAPLLEAGGFGTHITCQRSFG